MPLPHLANLSSVDLGGSLAVASKGLYATGVSTDLSVTYLSSGGSIGDCLRAEVTCDKLGKRMAFTSIRFLNKEGQVVARGSHTKFIEKAWGEERNRVEEMRKEAEG